MLGNNIDLSLQHNALTIRDVLPDDYQVDPELDKRLHVRLTKRGVT